MPQPASAVSILLSRRRQSSLAREHTGDGTHFRASPLYLASRPALFALGDCHTAQAASTVRPAAFSTWRESRPSPAPSSLGRPCCRCRASVALRQLEASRRRSTEPLRCLRV